jgi:Tol biopolymer transport system component
MARRVARLLLVLPATAGLLHCVGDDPATSTGADAGGDGAAGTTDAPAPDSAREDAGADAPSSTACDRNKDFGTPGLFATVYEAGFDQSFVRFSDDDSTLYFARTTPSGPADLDLCYAKRGNGGTFGGLIGMKSLNSTETDESPAITTDQLMIFFASSSSGTSKDIFVASRAKAEDSFDPPAKVTGLAIPNKQENDPYVVPGGRLYFASTRDDPAGANYDIFSADIAAGAAKSIVPIPTVSGGATDTNPVVTPDELTIYFASNRATGDKMDIFVAHRTDKANGFDMPQAVTKLNSTAHDRPTWISPDECTLYFASDRSPDRKTHVYTASRPR